MPEYYNAPGSAAFDSLQQYLLQQRQQQRQDLLDSLAVKREDREAQTHAADLELKREQLQAAREDRAAARQQAQSGLDEKVRAKQVAEFNTKLKDMLPGDFPSPELIAEGQKLGIPVPTAQMATPRPDVVQPPGQTEAAIPAALNPDAAVTERVVPEEPIPVGVRQAYLGDREARQEMVDEQQIRETLKNPELDKGIRSYLETLLAVPKKVRGTLSASLFKEPKAETAVNNQIHRITINGKPVDANYNPKTLRYTYKGEDVTDKMDTYVAPPQPDRVFMQVGDQWVPRPTVAGMASRGEDIPLPVTGSTRTMMEGATMLRPEVQDLEGMAVELDKRGLFGPVMSRVRDVMAKAGTTLSADDPVASSQAWMAAGDAIRDAVADDPKLSTDRLVGTFTSSLGLMATGAGRVHGGARGGGSVQMLDHFKSLLSASNSLPMFQGRLDALDRYLKKYEGGPKKGPKTGGGAEADTGGGGKTGNVIRYDLQGNVIK